MVNHDIASVDKEIRRILTQVVEGFAIVMLDIFTASVVVTEERPEDVARTLRLLDRCKECRQVVSSVLQHITICQRLGLNLENACVPVQS